MNHFRRQGTQNNKEVLEKPDAQLRIRRVRPEDIPQIWELHRDGMNQYKVGIAEKARRRFYSDLLNPDLYYDQKKGELLIVEYRGEIIGMGGFKEVNERFCEFVRFSVARPYQGSGVGKLILTTLVQLAAKRGYIDFTLRTSVRQEEGKFYKYAEKFFDTFKRTNSPELDKELREVGALGLDETLELITMEKDMNSIDYIRHLFDNHVIYHDPRIAIDYPGIPESIPDISDWKDHNNGKPPIPHSLLEKNNLENVPWDLWWIILLQKKLGPLGEKDTREYVNNMLDRLDRIWYKKRFKNYRTLRSTLPRKRKTGNHPLHNKRIQPRKPRTYRQRVRPSTKQNEEIKDWAKVVQRHWMKGDLESRNALQRRLLSPGDGRMR